MLIPDEIGRTGIALEDQFFDLKGLAAYSSMGVSSLRYHIREHGLPTYCIRNEKGQVTKTLVKRSEFDSWMKRRWQQDIESVADEVLAQVRK
nr:hypothetical protein 13 [Desulfobacteraceae bacterium]